MLSFGLAATILAASAAAQRTNGTVAPQPNTFQIIGDARVSAQMLFVINENKVQIVDKVENNPGQVNGHPAWAAEFDLETRQPRMLDIRTNSFCAGGAVLGDGRWINAGGNQAVSTGGQAVNDVGTNPYGNADGGAALRVMPPCMNETCYWIDDSSNYMNSRRWYPTVETLQNGDSIIIGGDDWGGFVNDASQNNPTYEFFPSRGGDQPFDFLGAYTMPANLYPLTWLVPSGKLFVQANWGSAMLDPDSGDYNLLPNITKAVKTYPASGATVMLAQNAGNNWTAPILFCGGADYEAWEWQANFDNTDYFRNKPNSKSCVQITPDDARPRWTDNDDMPEERSMGQFNYLPDGRIFMLNGIHRGVAGYNVRSVPYGEDPLYAPAYFNPNAPAGERWSRDDVQNASLPRLYHSTASLLMDGSIIVGGSNPYADFQRNGSRANTGSDSSNNTEVEWWSETRLEIFYPSYYNEPRPEPADMPSSIGYGGDAFSVSLRAEDVQNLENVDDAKFVVIRPGFSTHAIQFGQRFVELESSITQDGNDITMHVKPLPPNPAVLAPGPAWAFVVINGVPSQGVNVMIGSGTIEQQPRGRYPTIPASNFSASGTSSSAVSSLEVVSTGVISTSSVPSQVTIATRSNAPSASSIIVENARVRAASSDATRFKTLWSSSLFAVIALVVFLSI